MTAPIDIRFTEKMAADLLASLQEITAILLVPSRGTPAPLTCWRPVNALATRIKTELDARSIEIAAVRPDSINTHQTGN